jgi:hypothetical protein
MIILILFLFTVEKITEPKNLYMTIILNIINTIYVMCTKIVNICLEPMRG